jgi:Family of unknown function (DUF5681)
MEMSKTHTSYPPGKSGNPNGRPTKKRALTEILERTGAATTEIDGKRMSGKRLVAHLLWQAATTGTVQFPGDEESRTIATEDWIGVVKFIYSHVDGPPKSEMDITSGGEPLLFLDR